ncbi:MAG TPA: hypothetical protein VKX17_13345 [Planctomycetota bacterium]|nr:hypothetical protein [Planctomycetota bacterium]
MKLFRFHLSTLLLLCVFAGAVLGLCLDSKLWRLEKSASVESNVGPWAISIAKEHPWIYQSKAALNGEAISNELPPPRLLEIITFDRLERRVDTAVIAPYQGNPLEDRFNTDGDIDWIMLSPDRQHLAVGMSDHIQIYRRTHDYGWRGYVERPLFWIAALSALWLLALCVRWLNTPLHVKK